MTIAEFRAAFEKRVEGYPPDTPVRIEHNAESFEIAYVDDEATDETCTDWYIGIFTKDEGL